MLRLVTLGDYLCTHIELWITVSYVHTQYLYYLQPNLQHDKMAIDAKELVALCDEKTIAVVGILG